MYSTIILPSSLVVFQQGEKNDGKERVKRIPSLKDVLEDMNNPEYMKNSGEKHRNRKKT